MIKKFFLASLILILPLFAQYSFEFTCLDDTVKNAGFNDYIVFFFRLENTGSMTDIYEFNCTIIDSVPGWFVQYCIGGA